MNIVLCGHAGTGKDSLSKLLQENFRYERVVPVATRPMRDGEVDGVDYHFIDNDKFFEMDENDEIIAPSVFNDWNYGLLKSEFEKENWVVVANDVEFEELCYLRDIMNTIDFVSILITVDEDERIKRQIIRGDDTCEIASRLVRDENKWEELEDMFDYVISNDDEEWDAVVKILECIADQDKE